MKRTKFINEEVDKIAPLQDTDPGKMLRMFDSLPRWPFSPWTLAIIALGFLFTFYDIFNINVSFVQTCVQIKAGCTPKLAFGFLKYPLLFNLAGYVVGAVLLSPISDRIGRRNMLLVTMLITGIGSAYTALSGDMSNFIISRTITGIGTGADLAVVSTYLSEVSPRIKRGRYNALIYIASNGGAALGVWLGLILTTKAGHWPIGIPFAKAGPGFLDGWRWMYWVGAILSVVAILMRIELPESPRWLVYKGRLSQAAVLVERARSRFSLDQSENSTTSGDIAYGDEGFASDEFEGVYTPPGPDNSRWGAYGEIFRSPLYRRRAFVLLAMWVFAYVTVYSLAGGLTSLLSTFGYPQPEAGVIAAIGIFGLFLARLTNPLADRISRRLWIPISAGIMIIGAFVLSFGRVHDFYFTFAGAILLFLGNSLWVPITYAWSAEQFPTLARTSGFGFVDGIGHFGGGVGILLIAPVVPHLGILGGLLLIVGFLVVAAGIAQLNPSTQGESLEKVSP